VLPPAIIYEAAGGGLRDTWVAEITAGQHQVYIGSPPSGWSNDDLGFAWLEQVFDRHTKAKGGRSHRLLILAGHGSHITMDSIQYCHHHRILLAVFPPHSIHTLQPLDVVMFKPLSSTYSSQLTQHQQQALGLLPIKKDDFFPLFWPAWSSSFTPELVVKSFEACGIWPMNASVILKRFTHTPPISDGPSPSISRLSPSDGRAMERLVRTAMKDTHQKESKKLSLSLHQLLVQNELLQHENDGASSCSQHRKEP
jgi:hypothetical protein